MKVSKLHIVFYFLKLRWARLFRSNRISSSVKRRWERNLRKAPFYKRLIDKGEKFPLMNKAISMEYFDELNMVDIKKKDALALALKSEQSRDFTPMIGDISVGLSSGTSGSRGIFLTSKREKEIWVAAVFDRVIGLTLRKRTVAFFLRANNNLYESVKSKRLAFQFFDTKIPIKVQMERLIALSPDVLVAQPSVMMEIAKHIEHQGVKLSFSKVISVAEVLELDQKAYFEKVFGCSIDQVYQCTEGFLAHTCSAGRLHFNEDWLLIEKKYLDESRTRFHPIITDYLRSSQAVVRYELNDIIHEGPPCSCGLRSMVIAKIEGRSDDVFRFFQDDKEIIIYPDFIRRAVISATDNVLNYMVVRKSEHRISVSLDVENREQLNDVFLVIEKHLHELFCEFGLVGIEVALVEYEHDSICKLRRIKNEYTKSI